MNYYFTLFAFVSLFSSALLAQDHPIEEQVFNQINEIGFTSDGHVIVMKEKGDHLIHVIHPETFKVEQKLVRRGNGPGELPQAFAYYIGKQFTWPAGSGLFYHG